MTALVSVVLPVFDDEAHLEDAVERVLAQRGVDVELVIVDDGSSDGSRVIAQAAADRDPRVVFRPLAENGGVARARRHGVEAASGTWVWFVDSDDAWPSDAAARLVAAAAQGADTDVVVAAADVTHASGRAPSRHLAPSSPPVDGREAFRLLLTGDVTGHLWNKLFRRELLLGIEFTPARVQSDLAMTAQSLAAARRVAFLPETVYEYRIRSSSIITSRSRRAESLELIAGVVDRVAATVQPPLTGTDEHRYFVVRYLTLSGIKDAVTGAWSDEERAGLLRRLRPRLGPREFALLARRRDAKRLALAATARTSLRAYRKVLAAGNR
ncbi:glycosyltransferase family 2 protein [Modestobacter versicolor]|uniref:Glycosyltransferase involved in cell wall biosynthesis n=1 Tax=Modestobacter versicolor TaxID=429133 RepID=A0A839YB58_9ACTN|nr:glycosyltransferase family 2 protein [Modestobacter versicolor]MBB3676983.1 glycosyltransferase involved in cell wall biosynthesis [Modestobacter versicolor]